MNFVPDLEDDCLLFDGNETVTLFAPHAVVVAGAKRGPLDMPELEFRQIGIESADLVWMLPGNQLGEITPGRGDSVQDSAGTNWTILSVRHLPLTNVWRVVTRRHY